MKKVLISGWLALLPCPFLPTVFCHPGEGRHRAGGGHFDAK
jgi:hypothetical protein